MASFFGNQQATPEVVLTEADALAGVAQRVAAAPWTAVHVQGQGADALGQEDPRRGQPRLLALAPEGGEPVLLDVARWKTLPPELAAALEVSPWVMQDAHRTLGWMDLHFDLKPARYFCTHDASRLLTAGSEEANDLESLATRFGLPVPPMADSDEWGGLFLSQGQLNHLAASVRAVATLRPLLAAELTRAGLDEIHALETRLLPVVLAMEKTGMPICRERLEALHQKFRAQLLEETETLHRVFGTREINFSSPSQVLEALHREGLEVADTQEKTLMESADERFIPPLLAFRATEKQWQQVRGLLAATDAHGRIHSSFDPLGTDTGRFASASPNLQNVARGPVRTAFRASPGRVLVLADYAQVELRAAAAWARDTVLLGAFARGEDPHLITAAAILDKAPEAVTPEQRQLAKSVNFGLLYGQGAEGWVAYARQKFGLRFTVEEALVFRDRFFDRYRQLAAWHAQAWKAVQDGAEEIRTPLGRRRLVSLTANRWSRFTALVNTPIQGGTADGLKWAMILAAERLPKGSFLVATIHDELVVEAEAAVAAEAGRVLEQAMREGMERGFPGLPTEVSRRQAETWA